MISIRLPAGFDTEVAFEWAGGQKWRVRGPSDTLEDRGDSLAAADAHCSKGVAAGYAM